MITAEEIIKEINDTVKPFEFKVNNTAINYNFIESIGKDYILAVNKKIGEIDEIFKKYDLFISILYDIDNNEVMPNLWYDENTPEERINDLDRLIDNLTSSLLYTPILNIDYYLLQQCFNTMFYKIKDTSIYNLKYVYIN